MHSFYRGARPTPGKTIRYATLAAMLACLGCASPGPPRAPSLRLPQPVRDLTASRIGDTVELHFTAPSQSTDKLPLPGGAVIGQICRQLQNQRCIAVASSRSAVATRGPNGTRNPITWTDTLPLSLVQGSPRLLAYRVEFFSATGRSAGPSAPAFTAAGSAPAPVEDFHADGSRLGIILTWKPSTQPGDVLLKRQDLAPAGARRSTSSAHPKVRSASTSKTPHAAAPEIVWLGTNAAIANAAMGTNAAAGNALQPDRTLDTTALPSVPYSYSAQRRLTVSLGDHTVEMRSSLSETVPFTLREIYPPPAPTGLTAVGFFAGAASSPAAAPQTFAVDLIWQPVDDTGLIAGLAGYNVYREALARAGEPAGGRARLNTAPVPVPSFHDTTANPATRYRYSVTSVDEKGNESRAVTVLLDPSTAP